MAYTTDLASLTATIINMAVKGYLAIEEDDADKFSLVVLSDTDNVSLNIEERAVAGKLFPLEKRRLALHDSSKKYVKEVVDAKQALYEALEAQFGKSKGYFSRNTPYSMPGCLFSLLFIVGLFWYVVSGYPAASSDDKVLIVVMLPLLDHGFIWGPFCRLPELDFRENMGKYHRDSLRSSLCWSSAANHAFAEYSCYSCHPFHPDGCPHPESYIFRTNEGSQPCGQKNPRQLGRV